MTVDHTPAANPFHAMLPLLGTSFAFVVLIGVGFILGGFAIMMR